MNKEIKSFSAEIKAISDEGTFEGYGSIFGNKDSYDDIVMAGAFMKSLQSRGMPALVYQHNMSEPIGVYREVREDDKGLYVKGELNLDTQRGREAYSLMKQGALRGLSIGFMPKEVDYDDKGNRLVKQVDLYEVSLVTIPANDKTLISNVKSAPDNIRDFEAFLRDVGYSRSESKAIASAGFKALEKQDDQRDVDSFDEEAIAVELKKLNDHIKGLTNE